MQRSVKTKACRPWVKAAANRARIDVQVQFLKGVVPLRFAQKIVRQRNPMATVADAVHESQCRRREQGVAQVIFDDNRARRCPLCFGEHRQWIIAMVQHIDQQHHVEGRIVARQCATVEQVHRNSRSGTGDDLDTAPAQVRATLQYELGNLSIAATNIEHAALRR